MLDNYERLDTGAIKQVNISPFTYDKKYVQDRYDQYGIQCDMISYLRYGFIMGAIDDSFQSVLDIGYGNGSFLKICQQANVIAYGTDISGYELLHGKFIDFKSIHKYNFDLVTLFDSLEHFHQLNFLNNLSCEYICISVPNCQYNQIERLSGEKDADEYFKNWKHRRENEHIWHFDIYSLEKTMHKFGYDLLSYGCIEDIIRKSTDGYSNILTAIFHKR